MLDPARKKNYEKITTNIIRRSVRVWSSAIDSGVCDTADGRDTPFGVDRLRRDTHLQREFNRDRLSLSLSRVIRIFWKQKL